MAVDSCSRMKQFRRRESSRRYYHSRYTVLQAQPCSTETPFRARSKALPAGQLAALLRPLLASTGQQIL